MDTNSTRTWTRNLGRWHWTRRKFRTLTAICLRLHTGGGKLTETAADVATAIKMTVEAVVKRITLAVVWEAAQVVRTERWQGGGGREGQCLIWETRWEIDTREHTDAAPSEIVSLKKKRQGNQSKWINAYYRNVTRYAKILMNFFLKLDKLMWNFVATHLYFF